MAHAEGQQHPIGVYFKVWGLLFVLSGFSYMVDYLHFESYLRWTLILVFMAMKATLIIAVFMHMRWERLALVYALALPTMFLAIFVGLMMAESDNTFLQRVIFFAT